MGYKHNIADILDAGSEVIRKNGYHNVGVNQILKACDIPKGSFYNFFESKEDFVNKAVDRYGQFGLERITFFMTDPAKSPIERLKWFYAENIEANKADGLNGGCLVNNLSMELGSGNPKTAQIIDQWFNKWVDKIADCVREGQAQGEIIDTMSAREIAEYLHAGFSGTFPSMKVRRNTEFMDSWNRMTFEFISK